MIRAQRRLERVLAVIAAQLFVIKPDKPVIPFWTNAEVIVIGIDDAVAIGVIVLLGVFHGVK